MSKTDAGVSLLERAQKALLVTNLPNGLICEILAALRSPPVPQCDAEPVADPLAALVERFSKRLLAKLRLARANGKNGWERDDWEDACQQGLLRHIEKGDPRDVAAYCAFMDHHGWITKAAAPARCDAVTDEVRHAFRSVDDIDWAHLDQFIPQSGHGRFWRALFAEVRAALASPPPAGAPSSPLCSCKASQRDGQHMMWCSAVMPDCGGGEAVAGTREALEKIAGTKEYAPEDYAAAARYKPEQGLWTIDEYLADRALAHLPVTDEAGREKP